MNDTPPLDWLYTSMAAVAGAIASLGTQSWETMNWRQIFFVLFTSASFAIYVAPWAVRLMWGPDVPGDAMRAVTFVCATGSNVILPTLIRRAKRIANGEDPK